MPKIALLFVAFWLYVSNVSGQVTAFAEGAVVGNFTVTDIHGETHNLYDYCNAGNYVVLDFFAYWCGTCAQTAPKVNEFYRTYGCNSQNVKVIAIEVDGSLSDVQAFEAATSSGNGGFAHPTVAGQLGGSAVHTQFGVTGYPTVCLIAPNKTLLKNRISPIIDGSDIAAAFPNGAISPLLCTVSTADKGNNSGVNFYPNPADQSLFVKVAGEANRQNQYTISDALGRELMSGTVADGDVIDISHYPTGCYWIRSWGTNHPPTTHKLWIQR